MNLTEIDVFYYKGQPIRVFGTYAHPWFAAADVCAILELDLSKALPLLDENERWVSIVGPSFEDRLAVVDQSGLLSLIGLCYVEPDSDDPDELKWPKSPEVEMFMDWALMDMCKCIRLNAEYPAQKSSLR